ncbi:hypothetical protein GCK72_016896 [Caenorhabditis remanei]|uniref:Uncharacterized protein n=1 Tax=Caenorhabditis remanei TaxID=31234 RepID=A0A6A5G5W7_CAERE|nr:hypothetical protein GCK72_016896 [Caenorhabditis remanei]KAF1750347.1 hypothetical protein GCK72_016896 [Caenorhabditis remanei]
MEANPKRSIFVYLMAYALKGEISLHDFKTQIATIATVGPWRPHIQMVVAILENRPMDVLRIGGNHEFVVEEERMVAEILVCCAAELIREEWDKEKKEKEENGRF